MHLTLEEVNTKISGRAARLKKKVDSGSVSDDKRKIPGREPGQRRGETVCRFLGWRANCFITKSLVALLH